MFDGENSRDYLICADCSVHEDILDVNNYDFRNVLGSTNSVTHDRLIGFPIEQSIISQKEMTVSFTGECP